MLAFSIDNQWLASASEDNTTRIINVHTKDIKKLEERKDGVESVAYSRDGRWLASAGVDQFINIWDVVTWKRKYHFPCDMPIYGLGFDSGNLIAASGHHENIWIWNLKDEKSQKIHTKHVGNIWCVSYRLNGQLTSAGVDGSVRISDSSNQKVIHFSLHDGAIYWLHYSNDGKSIASSSADGTIRVLNINVLDATLSRDVNELLKESEKNTGLTIENSVVVPSHEIYH